MNLVLFVILGVFYFLSFLSFSVYNYDYIYIPLLIVTLSQVLVIKVSKLRYESPILWYSSAVFTYHFSSLFLYVVGFYNFENPIESCLIYGIVYYFSVIPLFFCKKNNVNKDMFIRFDRYFESKVVFFIYLFFMILVLLLNLYFFNSGYSNKGEAILLGGTRFNFIYNWAGISALLFLIRYRDSRLYKLSILFTAIVFLFTSLNTGERNVILSYMLSVTVILVVLNKVSRKSSFIFIIVSAAFIPVLQELKTVFSKDLSMLFSSAEKIPFYVKLFQGEFRSASRNIDWLFTRNDDYTITYGLNIIQDILIGFSPIKTGLVNTQSWFNNTFFPHVVETGQGYGFSLYGSFFVAFSYLGLVVISILFSIIITKIYNASKNNVFLFLLSILMITPLIYAQRGDLSVVLSFINKQTILPIIIFYLMSRFFRRV